jgi:hypothetical protein
MLTKKDLETLAETRLGDATHLFGAQPSVTKETESFNG